MDVLGYDDTDFIPCEVCRKTAQDIHHIKSRGRLGSTKLANVIKNLMALCRMCHEKYGDKEQYMTFLQEIHDAFLKTRHEY